ncbi:MAG: ATP-binding protein [Patescibacteria group bacterium]
MGLGSSNILTLVLAAVALGGGAFLYWRSRRQLVDLRHREQKMERRMYELAILKELQERTGYSLNVQNIIDIITGSLHQFMDYSAVSYMLLQPDKIIFKVDLEKSVTRQFISDIRDRMLKSLSALLDKSFDHIQVEEVMTGAILVDEVETPVQSFFNIPLVIGEKVVGVLTIADTAQDRYGEEETTILYKLTQQASQAVTRLQDVIQTEQRKLNSMVESMTEGVVMVDNDFRIVVVNPAAKKAVGIPPEQKEVTIFDFIDHLGGKFDIRGQLEESVKLHKVHMTDDVLIGDRYFQLFVAPVIAAGGITSDEVLGGAVIFRDITHDKELDRIREDFTSMMVHELRSPLNGIYMMTQLMQKQKRKIDIKQLKERTDLIRTSTENMLTLVNDLLDAAKLEAGKFEIHRAPASLASLIKDRVAFYAPSAAAAGLALRAELDSKLPTEIQIDANRITQVLNNLISNGLKFTGRGGSVIIQAFLHSSGAAVESEAEAAGIHWLVKDPHTMPAVRADAVIVAVTDTGQGIAREHLPQLFNKFTQFQSQAEKKEKKGTGLGLVIAKGIVEAHHGSLYVVSELGVGTTFYFTLPIR